MKKKIFMFLILFIFFTYGLFAGPISETNSWFLPRSCINSESKMYDLKSTLTCNSIPACNYNDESVYNGQVSRFRSALRNSTMVTIQPGVNGWYFVNENNVTMKRPFTLKGYRYEWILNGDDYSNTSHSADSSFSGPVSGYYYGDYSFTLPSSSWTSFIGFFAKCEKFYEEEIVFELPSFSGTLETGFYYAEFSIIYMDINGVVTQNMRIKGYVDMPTSEVVEPFSFSVSPTDHAYSIDLENTTSYVEVVSLDFNNSQIETLSGSPSGSSYNNRYTIYIAPTNEPTLTVSPYQISSNPYVFIRKGTEYQTRTEKNTIEYEIFSSNYGSVFSSVNNNGIIFKFTIPYSYEEIGGGYFNRQYLEKWEERDKKVYIKAKPPVDSTAVREAGSYYSNLYFFIYYD